MNDHDALFRHLCEHPDDDTARLVYADWLQESGDEPLAEFIRVQCKLAQTPPNHAEHFELTQLSREWEECYQNQWKERLPAEDGDLSWSTSSLRGFPARIGYFDHDEEGFETELLPRLREMLNGSPVRGLDVGLTTWEQLEGLLTMPKHGPIRDLEISTPSVDDWLPMLVESPLNRELRRLSLEIYGISDTDFNLFAIPDAFAGLEVLELSEFAENSDSLREMFLVRGPNLRDLELTTPNDDVLIALAESGPYPHLHTLKLHVGEFSTESLARLAEPDLFPSLADLHLCHSTVGYEGAKALARFPRNRIKRLILANCWIGSEGLLHLIEAGVLDGIHELNLHSNHIDDAGIEALVGSGCLAEIRRLDLDVNPFGNAALATLGKCPYLNNLIHLDLSAQNRSVATLTSSGLKSFLKNLQAPRLREIRLNQLPVGVTGMRTLLDSSFAPELRFLHLERAGLGDKGASELISSHRLSNLMWASLLDNQIRTGADLLADPTMLPTLAWCNLRSNPLTSASAERLSHRQGIVQ